MTSTDRTGANGLPAEDEEDDMSDLAGDRVYFDNRKISQPKNRYVGWVDLMGARSTMLRSLPVAANFIGKLHAAALIAHSSTRSRAQLYPVVDGVYITSTQQWDIRKLLAEMLRRTAITFLLEPEPYHRFMLRGGLAFGPMCEGPMLAPASNVLSSTQSYSDWILFGIPMVQAYISESKAAPFGIWVDESARSFSPDGDHPMAMTHWHWWRDIRPEQEGARLSKRLGREVLKHLEWSRSHSTYILYEPERAAAHSRLAAEYFAPDAARMRTRTRPEWAQAPTSPHIAPPETEPVTSAALTVKCVLEPALREPSHSEEAWIELVEKSAEMLRTRGFASDEVFRIERQHSQTVLSTDFSLKEARGEQLAQFIVVCREVAATLLLSGFLVRGRVDLSTSNSAVPEPSETERDLNDAPVIVVNRDILAALPIWAQRDFLTEEGSFLHLSPYGSFYSGSEVLKPDPVAFATVRGFLLRLSTTHRENSVVARAQALHLQAASLAARWPDVQIDIEFPASSE